jgi:hypothetical protein
MKSRPKRGPTHFLSKLIRNPHLGKSCQTFWATSTIIINLPKVKCRPLGENTYAKSGHPDFSRLHVSYKLIFLHFS